MEILDVEKNACIGCGACISIDEEHFDWDDDGLSKVISNDNLKTPNLDEAIESCPTGAIRIAEGQTYDAEVEDDNSFDSTKQNILASSSSES